MVLSHEIEDKMSSPLYFGQHRSVIYGYAVNFKYIYLYTKTLCTYLLWKDKLFLQPISVNVLNLLYTNHDNIILNLPAQHTENLSDVTHKWLLWGI